MAKWGETCIRFADRFKAKHDYLDTRTLEKQEHDPGVVPLAPAITESEYQLSV